MPFRPDGTVALVLLGIPLINGIVRVVLALIAFKALSLRERSGCLPAPPSPGPLQDADTARPSWRVEKLEGACAERPAPGGGPGQPWWEAAPGPDRAGEAVEAQHPAARWPAR